VDPTWHPGVIAGAPADPDMVWSRWSAWTRGDPRWRVEVVDTSELPVDRVAERLARWIASERALTAAGRHPLGGAEWAAPDGGDVAPAGPSEPTGP
jgi:hypothetical protein